MRIAINMHFFSQKYNSIFLSLVDSIFKINFKDEVFLYGQFKNIDLVSNENINIVDTSKFVGFYWYNIFFFKELRKNKFDIFINFDDIFPVFFVKNVFFVVFFLENMMYPDKEHLNLFKKYVYLFNLKYNLKNTHTFFCLTEKSKMEMNEKLNIKEDKIKILKPFFLDSYKSFGNHKNIFLTHWIDWEYLIYNNWVWSNKNTDRLLQAFKKVSENKKIFLFCLWKEISEDLDFRSKIIENNLQNKVIFTQEIQKDDLELYYKNSIWVIYPVLYEVFPFNLSDAVNYNVPILASDIDEIRNIFGDSISYFNPIFLDDMIEKLEDFVSKKDKMKINFKFSKNYNSIYFLKELFKNLNITC